MSDPRQTPANARVMAADLPDDGSGQTRVTPKAMQIAVPLVDLLRTPGGRRDRQLLLGDAVNLLETRSGHAFVQATKDGYVGYVPADALEVAGSPTHRVAAPATHAYPEPDMKSPERESLSFGALLTVTGEAGAFLNTNLGYVPRTHLRPVRDVFDDPVEVAQLFLGTPYLWGGNSRGGVDCSGLVQAACLACGIDCPGDSDMQEALLGHDLPGGTAPARGDLLFWKGHVAWVAAPGRLLHANAHAMAVTYEDIDVATARIADAGDGPVNRHKRL